MSHDVSSLEGLISAVHSSLSELRFIAKVHQNEKVDVDRMQAYENNWINTAYRTIMTPYEDKKKTLEFLKKSISEGLVLAHNCYTQGTDFSHRLGRLLIEALKEIKPAIGNLQTTYKVDRYYVSDLETLSSILDARIIDIESIYGDGSALQKPRRSAVGEARTGQRYYPNDV